MSKVLYSRDRPVGAEYLLPHEVGKILGVSAERVRQLSNAGFLRHLRTAHGWRLYHKDDVEELLRKREAAKEAQEALRRPV